MNGGLEYEAGFEPERYELDQEPRYQFDLDRRDFVKSLGGGVVVLLLVQNSEGQQRGRRRFGARDGPREIGAWLHINEDGIVTVYTGKVEVGQNIRTSLTQVVAEELHVALDRIRLVMADTQLTPYDMGTFGSLTTPRMIPQLRRAAASAREILIDLAAEQWKTEGNQLTASEGQIVNTQTNQSVAFGKLTKGQKLTKTVSDRVPTTPVEEWQVAGRSPGKVNGRAIVTGEHKYSSDIKLGGMLYGKVLRPTSFGATLAPLEPRAAVAQWNDGKLTVWTGTQRPFGVQSELARALRISEENVRVIVPDTGSGDGGKHSGELAIEAARLALAAGRPVKLVWTREEEFTWAYFRPAGVIDARGGVLRDGTLTAWEFHNYNSGGSAIDTPYEVPNKLIQFHRSAAPLRQGSYRALASTANVFARETHMDELAHAVGMDPLAFRLKNLRDERLRAVFQAAAKAFGWETKAADGRGFGIGGGTEKGSYVATCAEVEVDRDSGAVRVVRALSAFECGAVVNPDQLKNQVEGSMMMGLGGALFEAIEFADGKILNPQFSKYRVPRFRDTPEIEVVLLDRKDLSSAGAGETPMIGIAPAIGNAIFAATGKRLRSLPLAPKGVVP